MPCLYCKQPLTLVQEPSAVKAPDEKADKQPMITFWECQNPDCISNRKKKTPT